MTPTVIELNDAGILAGREGKVLGLSPGYAVLEGGGIRVGTAAFNAARLHPRSTLTSFWDRLGLEPVGLPGSGSRTFADVAFAHLKSVWQEHGVASENVLLAVPGSFTREQLGLVLGMAKECEIPVTGLVDAAVAAATRSAAQSRSLHLDIQLHRVVLTELSAAARLVRRGVHENGRFGLVALREAWADVIADAFVRETRFDPMHVALTEQALHTGMASWMAELAERGEALLELKAGERSHAVTVKRDLLATATRAQYAQIGQLVASCIRPGEPVTLLLSHRVQALPGLTEALARVPECRCVVLGSEAVVDGVLRHAGDIASSGDALEFVTSLPLGKADVTLQAPAGAAPTDALAPTHVLYRALAYPLTAEPLVVGTRVPEDERGIGVTGSAAGVSRRHLSLFLRDGAAVAADHSTYGSFLNGQRISGELAASAGDRIRIGSPVGEELQLIRIVD